MLYRKLIELGATGGVIVTYLPAPAKHPGLASRALVGQLALCDARADRRSVGGGVPRLHFDVGQARAAATGGSGRRRLDRQGEYATGGQQRGAAHQGDDSS